MKPATGKTICIVLERYAEWLQGPSDTHAILRERAARALNDHLDSMVADGVFGRDGLEDPRRS